MIVESSFADAKRITLDDAGTFRGGGQSPRAVCRSIAAV
jgi:hypothetical protein